MKVTAYEDLRLCEISWSDLFSGWDASKDLAPEITHVRIVLPPNRPEYIAALKAQGFFFVDRTVMAVVNLKRQNADLKKLARFPVQPGLLTPEEILKMAQLSFSVDRRFHLDREFHSRCAEKVLRAHIGCLLVKQHQLLVCEYKNQAMGLIILTPYNELDQEISLGLVQPEFQRTGAALSLYYGACEEALTLGAQRLYGRISTANTPVMNLYSMLGAQFSEPEDVYFKEVAR